MMLHGLSGKLLVVRKDHNRIDFEHFLGNSSARFSKGSSKVQKVKLVTLTISNLQTQINCLFLDLRDEISLKYFLLPK